MKRILIIVLLIFVFSACGKVTNPAVTDNVQSLPIATRELGNPTLESTELPEPISTQQATIQEITSPHFSVGSQNFGSTVSFGKIGIADFDMDGDFDIFFPNYRNEPKLWFNDGNREFTKSGQYFGLGTSETHDIGIADLNGDSYPDIFTISHNDANRIFFNDGTGLFTESEQKISEDGNPIWLLLGDVDVDGDVDAIIMYSRPPNFLWLNDGNGVFTRTDSANVIGSGKRMYLADFNGDNFPDLFYIKDDATPGDVWFNDGAGSFAKSGQEIGTDFGAYGIATGDIDRDGDQDIISSSPVSDHFLVWINQDGLGSFPEYKSYYQPMVGYTRLFDADLDGDLDYLAALRQGGCKLWVNDGEGVFTETDTDLGNNLVTSFGIADFDADGDNDIVFGFEDSGNRIYWNE